MKCRRLITVSVLTAGLLACATSPLGRNQFLLMPADQMDEMGSTAYAQMKQEKPQSKNSREVNYVLCVSNAITSTLGGSQQWEVTVFQEDSANAFALPGGKIGVNQGLLKVAVNDAQLAAVIGHEVAHVLAQHGNERLTQELGIKALLLLVGLFSEGDADSERIIQALGLGAHLGIALPFSRAHEEEADVMGLELMASAGFDPRESTQLWRNMAAAGGGQPLEFLSTHPNHESRIEELQARMNEAFQRYQKRPPATCNQ